MFRVALLLVAGFFLASPVLAQAPGPSVSSYAPTDDRVMPWEARVGTAIVNPGGRESNLANLSGELVSPRVVTLNDRIANAFMPRFHLGSSLNFNGTRFAYAGATWTVDLSKMVFVEASLGAALNDGKTGVVVPENRLAMGCNTSARGAAALGMRLSDRWSLIATLEHFNATGCGDKSRGPANFGAKLGYTF